MFVQKQDAKVDSRLKSELRWWDRNSGWFCLMQILPEERALWDIVICTSVWLHAVLVPLDLAFGQSLKEHYKDHVVAYLLWTVCAPQHTAHASPLEWARQPLECLSIMCMALVCAGGRSVLAGHARVSAHGSQAAERAGQPHTRTSSAASRGALHACTRARGC
jgi:hypothetical protein